MSVLVRWVVIGTVVLVVVIWGWKSLTPEPKKLSEALHPDSVPAAFQEPDGLRMRRALAVASWQKYSARAADARKALDLAVEESRLWKSEIEPLLTSEEGRRLSGDEQFVTSVSMAMRSPKPDLAQIAALRVGVDGLMKTAAEIVTSKEVSFPSPEMEAQLQKIVAEAQGHYHAYNSPRSHIQGLLAQAKIRGSVGQTTLEGAISEQARQDAVLLATARQEQTAAESVKNRANEKARIESIERAKRNEIMEHERCTQSSRRDLQETFAPFLAEGHRTAYDDHCGACQLSYGQLQKKGVLNSPSAFLEFAKESNRLGRPTWGEDVRPLAAERLATFQFLAPAWIRLGLLRP
jgi:hypothetical protein